MIRFAIIVLVVVLFLVLSLPLLLVEVIIGKFNEPLMRRSCLRIVQFMFRVVQKLAGIKLTVIGQEKIPTDTPVLYVANHRGAFDIIVGYTYVIGLCGFIAKIELKKVPLLNLWMNQLYCLFLDRENIRAGLDTILKAIDQVKNGVSMFICPEGTRNSGDEMLPFKEGGMKIAEKTGCPIVPVAFYGTDHVFERQMPRICPADVFMVFGDPIYTAQLDRAEKKHLGERCRTTIQGMLDEIRANQ